MRSLCVILINGCILAEAKHHELSVAFVFAFIWEHTIVSSFTGAVFLEPQAMNCGKSYKLLFIETPY